jgi:hypothetical protein
MAQGMFRGVDAVLEVAINQSILVIKLRQKKGHDAPFSADARVALAG